jgi:hypothetical protein
MRELFQVRSQKDYEIDKAMLSHGGGAGLELSEENDAGLNAAV